MVFKLKGLHMKYIESSRARNFKKSNFQGKQFYKDDIETRYEMPVCDDSSIKPCFVSIPSVVLTDPNLSPLTKMVYFYLLARIEPNTREWFFPVKTIAEDLGFSRPAVKKSIHDLFDCGLIRFAEVYFPTGARRSKELYLIDPSDMEVSP